LMVVLLGVTLGSIPVWACEGENCEDTPPIASTTEEEGGGAAGATMMAACPGITGTLIILGGGTCLDK